MTADNTYRRGARSEARISRSDITVIGDVEKIDMEAFEFVDGVTTIDCPLPNRLVFLERYSDTLAERLCGVACQSMLFVVTPEYRHVGRQPRLLTKTPRAVYTRIVKRLFGYIPNYWRQEQMIDSTARIGERTFLSPGVAVGRNSIIGVDCFVYPNVVIGPNCHIGDRCTIKSGSVIGQPGFGVIRDESGVPYHFPHVGGVKIDNDVEIGALNTVCAGSIHPTIIGAHVKTDDHVHIAHNCAIGAGTLITACAEISGSVSVGTNCWIGPNSSIRDGLVIGTDAFIGIGANVTKSVADGATVAGNPARPLHKG